jgi:hypothetical protein
MTSISNSSYTEDRPEKSKNITFNMQPMSASRKFSIDPESKSLDPSDLDIYKSSRTREPKFASNVQTNNQQPKPGLEKKSGSFFKSIKNYFENKCGCCLCFD